MKILAFSFLALLTSYSAHAAKKATCVPQAEMQQIAQSFPQFQDLAQKDFCYSGDANSHLIAGIEFMRKTAFQSNMDRSQDELFSGRFASDWWGYFTQRINEFSIDDGCPKGVIAYVYAFGGNTMYVCAAALTDQFTGLDLSSVFMHEARHIDGFPHMMCSHGPRQGMAGACDKEISDGGSYAVTVETYSQLSKYSVDVNPALKAYARSASIVYADEAFEVPVKISRTERFMFTTKDLGIYTLNLDGSREKVGMAPELGHVVMRAQFMILFPENPESKARFLFPRNEGEIPSSPGDQADAYNALTPSERPNMVDVHISRQFTALVYKTKVVFDCDAAHPNSQELALSANPIGLLYPTGYDRAARSAQLMTDSGVMEIGCQGTQAYIKPSALSYDQKYRSLYQVGGLTLGLTQDGFVREITGSTSKPYSLGELDGKVQSIFPNQRLDFFGEK